ncbi:Plastidial lipoyltransferase 2 [Porphyridium purpureum]|uniref:lipoyl(octanoyl) transferase n=1 Tax=Porphyridium purpureum TaxID=35688 RepID=A0A5J4Z667_PORPP|nr:Plastidial lipoyltransferase 2 [Porphyridium purpureum]|eukprot:POR7679..scf295_1
MNQIPPPLPGGQENAVSLDGRAFLHAVVVVEHAPVYTLGTGSTSDNVLFDPDCPPYGASLVRTERGGEVTYHGPGQLVLYPILHLGEHNSSFKKDLHWYVSKLEESVILTLAEYGLSAGRKKGLIGVWVGDAKYCAIGVKVSKWVTMHGLALNVSTDMEPFSYIVPCGIHEYAVGSLNSSRHVKCNVPLHEVKQRLLHNFANVFDVTFAPPSMIW